MANLLMISGDRSLASGKKGAFYNTLEEFHKYWERIDIICPGKPGLRTMHDNLHFFENVYIHPSPWHLLFQPFWIFKKGKEIFKKEKFNLVTVHEYPPFYNGIGARMLWQKIKVPYVLELHHITGYPQAWGFKEKTYKLLTPLFIKWDTSKARVVRVVNKAQVPNFLKKHGIPEIKIKHIPSFYIDLNIFKPLNLEKQFDLIFIGRLEKNKGINLFIEAVNNLKIYNFEPKAVIVGDGLLKKDLRFKIRNLGMKNNIRIHGWVKDVSEVARLINQSRMLVMCSYNEGGPRVVLEAMACGVPVLATNVGLVYDFTDKNMVKIIDWNAKDIANKAKGLLEDEDEKSRLSRVGIETAQRFEKKAMIKNYASWLLSLIK